MRGSAPLEPLFLDIFDPAISMVSLAGGFIRLSVTRLLIMKNEKYQSV